ncbi:MAG: isochorismatase family protein [Chitinophagaceae bacterium]|nr:isochorismatase family protein [Chitinophagaceae bacterium]
MKLFLLSLSFLTLTTGDNKPAKVTFTIQKRIAVNGSDKYKIVKETRQWEPSETAIIICDMWNQHWCKGATQRVAELAPQMNRVLNAAREKGFLIVHAPSDCMEFYKEYPQRKTALKYSTPQDEYIEGNKLLPAEANAKWPVDQSNEGCNDTPRCEVRSPWKSQIELLDIKGNDIISDSGPEMQRLFKDKGVNRVVLMGVHTNMCVIARPFGMRSMITSGKEVYLMRDMTDLMYDARAYPYVNHFEGLGLMVEYIEKFIAPTVVSTDLTGQPAFRFKDDPRKN